MKGINVTTPTYEGPLELLYELVEKNKIDIYDSNIDGFKVKKILSKPISACKYCSRSEFFEWEQSVSDAKIEDFCVKGAKL